MITLVGGVQNASGQAGLIARTFSSAANSDIRTVDLVVIGGGSGGMAAAKEAAGLGAQVVLFDKVKPSTQGTTWGLGGTCVNVGCVPKKIMHYAANLAESIHLDGPKLLGDTATLKSPSQEDPEVLNRRWETLVDSVQNHIGKLNFSYRVGLRSAKVEYINALAKFAPGSTATDALIEYEFKGERKLIRAKNVLIATGGRPVVPDNIPGAVELAITSDDLFSLQRAPGKTLVVGASYIGLECAGLLNGLGFDATVAARSVVLRSFDRQCAEKVQELMKCQGVGFIMGATPTELKRTEDGRIQVAFSNGQTEVYDTVLFATGRHPDTKGLQLPAEIEPLKNGKLPVDEEDCVRGSVYAIGDMAEGRPELTPVAIKAGELWARRKFGDAALAAQSKFNWDLIPTTVFTPAEYGCVGLSEEQAVKKYGENDVEVYLWEWTTLEHAASAREKHPKARADQDDIYLPPTCLAKLVVHKPTDKVVGFHFVGPNAGEVTQGFAVALRAGATKKDFDSTIGIHPTDAEAFTTMTVTRRSGESWIAAGGCGGGKCG